MITSAQVVETSVTIPDNSPSQDYTHPDDQTTLLLCHFYDKLNSNSTPDFPKIKLNYLRSTNNNCVSYNCNITINVDTKVSGKNRWTKRKDTLFQGFIYASALLNPFVSYKKLAFNFSSQDLPLIKPEGHENKGNDHQFKKLMIVKQILLKYQRRCIKNSMENTDTDVVGLK